MINKLEISASPDVLIGLQRLERVLISKRILFKKVTIMPKGNFPKLKGSICNVPIDTVDISDVLPRRADSNGLVVIKLKCELTYRGHVSFEAVRPELLNQALMYLKENNPLYGDVAGMLSNNFSETVPALVAKDKSYRFINSIKGTPAYREKFLREVLAMVKQLVLPTFFMTLSCAELRWNELISIIYTLKGETLQEEEINRLDYFKRYSYLNLNPVVLARHFQYRVEIFFKTIVLDGILGKVKYHAIRVEFQLWGSPYIHSFLWII